jgi:hypothetical protein
VDGKLEAPKDYPLGVGWLWEAALLESIWDNRDSQSMRQEIVSVARNFKRIKSFALFSLEDPLPFIMHMQWRTRAWIWYRIQGITRRCVNAVKRLRPRKPAF